MDLQRQLTVIRSWSRVLVASVILAAVAAFLVSGFLPRVYEGRTTLIVGQSLTSVNPDYQQILTSSRLSEAYAQVASTGPILEKVIARLELPMSPQELLARISVSAPRDSMFITISASHDDPQVAADIANALADELIAASPTIQGRQSDIIEFVDTDLRALQRQIEDVQAQVGRLAGLSPRTAAQDQELEALQARLVTLRATYANLLPYSSGSSANLLSVVDPASPADAPSSPRTLLNTALAAMIALLVAIAVAFVVERFDDSLKKPADVEPAIGLPALGAIARTRTEAGQKEIYRLAALLYPRSPVAEAFRTLRTNIEFASLDSPVRSIVVGSSVPGEGKTTVAANLAVVFAQAGRRTILVDADMRMPGVHLIFDLPNTIGLTDLLRSDDLTIDMVAQRGEQPNLRVVTTGALPPNPAELLGSQRMLVVLERLRAECDLLIFDTPPVQVVTDAALLASRVEGTVLVVGAGRTRRAAIIQGREAFQRVGARILGVVLNRVAQREGLPFHDYYSATHETDPGVGAGSPASPTSSATSRRMADQARLISSRAGVLARPERTGGMSDPTPGTTGPDPGVSGTRM